MKRTRVHGSHQGQPPHSPTPPPLVPYPSESDQSEILTCLTSCLKLLRQYARKYKENHEFARDCAGFSYSITVFRDILEGNQGIDYPPSVPE